MALLTVYDDQYLGVGDSKESPEKKETAHDGK